MNHKNLRNFVIISHIDHGKSTLADRFLELTGTVESRKMRDQYLDQMDLERERGITIKLQPVRMIWRTPNHSRIRNPKSETLNKSKCFKSQIQNSLENSNFEFRNCLGFSASNLGFTGSEFILNLIDTPGHVDFSYEVSRSLAAVEGAILLVDATKGIQAQTLANLEMAQAQGLTIIPVVNKIDLREAKIEETKEELANLLNVEPQKIICISAKKGTNVDRVLETVVKEVPPPQEANTKPLRALVFDYDYNPYKGVIAYVRIRDGEVKVGDEIYLMASGVNGEALEVGFFRPEFAPCDILKSGEIGYIATGLKNVEDCWVGETIISQKSKLKPLPGYKEPQPVVFASLYPHEENDYESLRNALGKLKLSDASLVFEPESRESLGRGFKCGFLGMLHLEIVVERLKRDYGLVLLVTSPSVIYKADERPIYSPSDFPEGKGVEVKEPWARLEIISPYNYLGQILKLLKNTEGEHKETKYLSKEKVVICYQVPLREIISDFYDKLKSSTSGYASMSYSPIGYQSADLVKLDILIAEEPVEAFSKIVPEKKSYQEGRKMVGLLKEVLPPQLFAVPIQAAIRGKIIARETKKALKKDVIAGLYGGDYTRKRKLLEKQKKGKKKMKKFGKVVIPPEVFLKVLK